MQCPACKDKEVNLLMADRQGIEIDYCPQCRGIWLDRGELDRLIERAESTMPPPTAVPGSSRDNRYPERGDSYHDGRHPKKRKSLLGELFDF